MMISGEEQLTEAGRDILKNLLNRCTDPQKGRFNRMYKSVNVITLEKIPWAIEQCERTIEDNIDSKCPTCKGTGTKKLCKNNRRL